MAPEPPQPEACEALPAPLYRFLTHELRAPLSTIVTLLQQGLRRPAESPGHPRYTHVLQQAQELLQRLDAFNQTLWPVPADTALQETLLENLLHSACDTVRPQAAAKHLVLQLLAPVRQAFVPADTRCLVQALRATLQLAIAQAPQGATITLHSTLHSTSGLLHIGYCVPPTAAWPSGSMTHTLCMPTLVYDCAF